MDSAMLKIFDDSLRRCDDNPGFLDRFYEKFLLSSPKVREKFANTSFLRQKRALRTSLHLMLLVAADEQGGPERYLRDLAERHSKRELDIGAELYDLWLDSLLSTVRECDPKYDDRVEAAWENVMMIGVRYMLSRYNSPVRATGPRQ